jgi:hypothetical protein
MKRMLTVLVTSAALSAWGQAGQDSLKPTDSSDAGPKQLTTVYMMRADGRMLELAVPQVIVQTKGLVQSPEGADLERLNASQAGCPVQILQASFERPARLVLISPNSSDEAPTLHLEYQNSSGKDIASVVLTGWIKVKEDRYQLDATSRPFQLELSRKALLGKDVQAAEALKLVGDAIGFDRIELSQVTYADGSTWSPEQRSCVYANMGGTERAKAW